VSSGRSSPDSIKPFGFGDPIVDFCRNEKVARAYLVSPENRPLAVARFPGVDTAFLRIPAHVLTYFLGREESRVWKA